jgi:hypothetical protein
MCGCDVFGCVYLAGPLLAERGQNLAVHPPFCLINPYIFLPNFPLLIKLVLSCQRAYRRKWVRHSIFGLKTLLSEGFRTKLLAIEVKRHNHSRAPAEAYGSAGGRLIIIYYRPATENAMINPITPGKSTDWNCLPGIINCRYARFSPKPRSVGIMRYQRSYVGVQIK